mmetsp:Transcript_94726/g.246724  ORF Transcript_94726/g.246724 Transcript_94726/m.246724 type:complete len:228 (+) Transcript_94726:135-818(+)
MAPLRLSSSLLGSGIFGCLRSASATFRWFVATCRPMRWCSGPPGGSGSEANDFRLLSNSSAKASMAFHWLARVPAMVVCSDHSSIAPQHPNRREARPSSLETWSQSAATACSATTRADVSGLFFLSSAEMASRCFSTLALTSPKFSSSSRFREATAGSPLNCPRRASNCFARPRSSVARARSSFLMASLKRWTVPRSTEPKTPTTRSIMEWSSGNRSNQAWTCSMCG